MREAKKITFVIMMILPFLPVIMFMLMNIGGESNELIPMGSVRLTSVGANYFFEYELGSLSEAILRPIFGTAPLEGIFTTIAKLMLWFKTNVGIPICFPTVYVWLSLLYYAFIAMSHAIVELITFVPRKCAEIFR